MYPYVLSLLLIVLIGKSRVRPQGRIKDTKICSGNDCSRSADESQELDEAVVSSSMVFASSLDATSIDLSIRPRSTLELICETIETNATQRNLGNGAPA